MNHQERRELLLKIPFFSQALSPTLLDLLAGEIGYSLFPAGSTLMSSGDFGVSMYAILEGQVEVSHATEDGVLHEVAQLGPGDIVGEMSLMTGARRNATVSAASGVSALEITKVALEELLARSPELVNRFSAMLAGRQARLDRIDSEAAHSAEHIAGQMRRFFRSVIGG
jgi:CRP/FNR family cyclic AMP-dependent transcriptional regulator